MSLNKLSRFNKICREIKNIHIQGASNIAKAGLEAYRLFPNKSTKKKILSLRPTEPMLENILELAEKGKDREILEHFKISQDIINKSTFNLIKNNHVIFTHCHSSNVIRALIYAKKKGKNFEVYNTETRPLYQGRKTAKELKNAKIKVTMFVDSAISIALTNSQGTRDVDLVLLGADAILKNGVINKVGSNTIAQLAKINKIPVYIIADSWKFTNKKTPLESRELNEVWDKAPKHIKIKNPAFELIKPKYISGIISELGNLSYEKFLKEVRKNKD